MIEAMSHVCIYVEDQDRALEFYTTKLGFEVCADERMEGMRWLTVSPPDQDLELILMEPRPNPMMDDDTVDQLRSLMRKGALGCGVFRARDCVATHERLSERGVEFVQDPTERPYGIEAMFKDDSGNVFALVQPSAIEELDYYDEEELDYEEEMQSRESSSPSGSSFQADDSQRENVQRSAPSGGALRGDTSEGKRTMGNQQGGSHSGSGGPKQGSQQGGKQPGGSDRDKDREGEGGKQSGDKDREREGGKQPGSKPGTDSGKQSGGGSKRS